MATTHQYEPLKVPSNWTTEEKKFAQQLTDIFDQLYGKFNRLRFTDMNTEFQQRITDTEDNVSSITQTASEIELRVENAEGDISTITQTAAEIETRVSNAEGDISTISQTAEQIQLEVTSGSEEVALVLADIIDDVGVKTTIFYQDEVPTSTAIGDLWYDTNATPVKIYRAEMIGADAITAGEWVDITTNALSQALSDASDAQSTADGRIVCFAQDGIPTSTAIGDLWVDTNDENKLYRAAAVGADEIKAGEWVLYEVAAGHLQTSSITISGPGIELHTSEGGYIKATVGDETPLFIDEGGLTAPVINGNVQNTFEGVAGVIPWAGSITSSLAGIGKILLTDSTLTVPAGTYTENVIISGFTGSKLHIIFTSGVLINGYINVRHCDYVSLYTKTLDTVYVKPPVSGSYGIRVYQTKHFYCYRLNVSGFMPTSGTRATSNGTDYGIYIEASRAFLVNGSVDTTCVDALHITAKSSVYLENFIGGVVGGSDPATVANLGYGIRSRYGSDTYAYGTIFASVDGDVVYRAPAIGGAALTPTATTGSTPATPDTAQFVKTGYGRWTQGTIGTSFNWYSTYTPATGVDSMLARFGIWIFGDMATGTDLDTATLTLTRKASEGYAGAVTLKIYTHAETAVPANDTIGNANARFTEVAAMATSFNRGETKTIAIPPATVAAINAGTVKGFGIAYYNGPSIVMTADATIDAVLV